MTSGYARSEQMSTSLPGHAAAAGRSSPGRGGWPPRPAHLQTCKRRARARVTGWQLRGLRPGPQGCRPTGGAHALPLASSTSTPASPAGARTFAVGTPSPSTPPAIPAPLPLGAWPAVWDAGCALRRASTQHVQGHSPGSAPHRVRVWDLGPTLRVCSIMSAAVGQRCRILHAWLTLHWGFCVRCWAWGPRARRVQLG